jgi:hypothetical protein
MRGPTAIQSLNHHKTPTATLFCQPREQLHFDSFWLDQTFNSAVVNDRPWSTAAGSARRIVGQSRRSQSTF